jgi:hypothetical protein
MSESADEPASEPGEYTTHKDQIEFCRPSDERVAELQGSLLEAFKRVISYREVPIICFDDFNAEELAKAFVAYPIIVKPTLCCVNIAGRAIERDLGLSIDTYAEAISAEHALMLAGYLKPYLPHEIAIPALLELDRYAWTDKEMRRLKGEWEKQVTKAISVATGWVFKKRRFESDGERFELDAAYPESGAEITIGVDVKRIEAPRDTQKRADEILNKARKFKRAYPTAKFFAIVYYPFRNQHTNFLSRAKDPNIDGIFFAGATASTISTAAEMLAGASGISKESITGDNITSGEDD